MTTSFGYTGTDSYTTSDDDDDTEIDIHSESDVEAEAAGSTVSTTSCSQPDDVAPGKKGAAKLVAKRTGSGDKLDRATIKTVIEKLTELTAATAENRMLLAAILGSPSDSAADLTFAVLTSAAASMRAVVDVTRLSADDDDFSLAIEITTLALSSRDAAKNVWALLIALGALPDAPAPAAEPKLAKAAAPAIRSLTTAELARLDAVRKLAGR